MIRTTAIRPVKAKESLVLMGSLRSILPYPIARATHGFDQIDAKAAVNLLSEVTNVDIDYI